MNELTGIWSSIVDADRAATLFINSLHVPFTDSIWQFMSERIVWAPLYLAIAVLLILKGGWRRGVSTIISIALIVVACDQFSNLIKHMVERLRPCWDDDMIRNGLRVLEGRGGKFGFFSAHAANCFGVAFGSVASFRFVAALRFLRIFSPCIYTWAFLVSVIRIFVGKRFLGDVLVGARAGLAIAYVMVSLEKYIWDRWIRELVSPSPSPGSGTP